MKIVKYICDGCGKKLKPDEIFAGKQEGGQWVGLGDLTEVDKHVCSRECAIKVDANKPEKHLSGKYDVTLIISLPQGKPYEFDPEETTRLKIQMPGLERDHLLMLDGIGEAVRSFEQMVGQIPEEIQYACELNQEGTS